MSNLCHVWVTGHDNHTNLCEQPVVGTITTRDHEGFKDTHPVCAHHMTASMEDQP